MDNAAVRPIAEIALLVRDRRTELRLSQRRAATLADVSSTTWQSFEKHHHPVSELTLSGMAHALRWPTDWFDRLQAGEDPAGLAAEPVTDGESWDVIKTSLSAEDQAAVRRILEGLRAKNQH